MSFFSDRRIRTSLVAVAADGLLIAIKLSLALVTGSQALWADALHSGTDLLVSLVLLSSLVLRYVQERRGDEQGKQRAQRFESVLAVLVAISILYVPYEIITQVKAPSDNEVTYLWLGIVGVLFSILVAYFMANLKTSVGRETGSPALEADGYHSHMDVLSSLAVLFSFAGLLMGLQLDALVAVLIAVMVGIAGIELLVSAIRSLLLGKELEQLSVSEFLRSLLQRSAGTRRLVQSIKGFVQSVRQIPVWLYLLSGLTVWGLSGWQQVPLGMQGIAQVFGRISSEPLASGLHYHWPWPVGSMKLVSEQEVRRLLVGTPLEVEQPGSGLLWQQWRESSVEPKDSNQHFITGDEALVDVTLALHYRLPQLGTQWQKMSQTDDLVQAFCLNALAQEVALSRFSDLLSQLPNRFLTSVAKRMTRDLALAGVAVEVVSIQALKVQPPNHTVAQYRDTFVAQQEGVRLKLLAEAENFQQVHTASAEKILLASEAQASYLEQTFVAKGEAERFVFMADRYRQFPDLVSFNRYLDHIQTSLSKTPLTVLDPSFDGQDLRIWRMSDSQTPLPDIRLK